jgi:hypothetical protein
VCQKLVALYARNLELIVILTSTINAQMTFLGHLLGIPKLVKGKNRCIREKNGSTE